MNALFARVNWKHGLKTAIAAGVCLWLSRLLGLRLGYWACVSTILVMQSGAIDTATASWSRLVGTAVGALVGLGASYFWNGHFIVYAIAVLVCVVLPEMLGLKGTGRLAGVTVTIVLLAASTLPHWVVARDRFIEVSVGIAVALVVSQLIWRDSAA